MTTLKASCPNCGEIELTADDVLVYLPTRESDEGNYEITCNLCNEKARKPANKRVVSVLLVSGAEAVYENEPIPEEYITKEVESFLFELEANSCLVEVLERELKNP